MLSKKLALAFVASRRRAATSVLHIPVLQSVAAHFFLFKSSGTTSPILKVTPSILPRNLCFKLSLLMYMLVQLWLRPLLSLVWKCTWMAET
jgi:hypothetical protein